MPTATTQTGQNSRQRIMDAALDLFVTKGYLGTSMREIAEKAGLAKATIYHHVRTKTDLALEVYRMVQENLAKREVLIISGERTTRSRIHKFVRQFFEWVKESPQEWLFFDAVVPTLVGHVDLPELELTAEGVARQVIIDGHVLNEVKNVPVDVLVWSFMIPVEVARFWAGGLLKGDIVDFAYEAAEMVWGAIRADSTA